METFDLENNNIAMNVITYLIDDPHSFLRDIFQNILHQQPLNINYHQTNNVFKYFGMQRKSNDIMKLLTQVVKQKIEMIQKTVIDKENINLAMYVNIWKQYRDFTNELTDFLRDKQPQLINLVSCTYAQIFFEDIILWITRSDKKIFINCVLESIFTFVETSILEEYFMANLFDFLTSLNTIFIFVKDKNVDLSMMIYTLIALPQIMEHLSLQMHTYLMEISNDNTILDNPKYYMLQPYLIKNNNISIATMILDLLCTHVIGMDIVQKNRFISSYQNFLQLRITMPTYDNLELEMTFVERIYGNKNNKMYLAILDIKNSIDTKYDIDGVKIRPLVLKKDNWIVDDVKLTINYPIKIKHYLDQISTYFPENIINWQPTLGICKFNTILGTKNVVITCNFLQAIALAYFDEQIEKNFTVQKFATYTQMNIALSSKIFESLFESYIIVNSSSSYDEYGINHMYNGKSKIDIRPIFVNVLEK